MIVALRGGEAVVRVALLGWDLDGAAAAALGGLGVEVVGVTRWFPGQPTRESRSGWLEARCPHEIGGAPRDEAFAFGVAVVREASSSGLGFEFDVIHALDWRTRPAAGELAARARDAVVLGSEVAAEEEEAEDVGFGPRRNPDGWICDHPLLGDRLRAKLAGSVPVFTIPERGALSRRSVLADELGREQNAPDEGPCLALLLGADARFSPSALVEGARIARERAPGLVVAVLGTGPRHDRLRRRLKQHCLLSRRWRGPGAPSAKDWNDAVASAAAVGVASVDPIDDPFSLAAGLAGVPAVSLVDRDAEATAQAIVDALFGPSRRNRDARVAEVLSERRVDPPSVAERWLGVYLRLLNGERNGAAERRWVDSRRSPQPLAFPELRTRLTMTPMTSREALASWSLRPDDWRAALEWLGPESVRAVLTIRVFDVSELLFDGRNAHGSFDVDLGPGENHRTITLPYAGRSLAACLGVRSPWGYFHPLAHARMCHLPRKEPAPPPPSGGRRLRVLPRRSSR